MLPPIERITAAEIRPGDIVLLHVPMPSAIEHPDVIAAQYNDLAAEWTAATGLKNKVVVVSGEIRVEIERPS